MKKTSQKESDTVSVHLKKKRENASKHRSKSSPKNVEKIDQKTSKNRPKNVPKMVPGASPGPPRGLPEASLGPPGAILEDMQRNAKKQEKKSLSGPHFSEKREI